MAARLTQIPVEVLAAGTSRARATQEAVEVLAQGVSRARLTHQPVEILARGASTARVTQAVIEVLTPVAQTGTTDIPGDDNAFWSNFQLGKVTFTNTLVWQQTLTDTITWTETPAIGSTRPKVTDTLNLTDGITGFSTTAKDTLVLTDGITYTARFGGPLTDTLSLSETWVAKKTWTISWSDTTVFSDTMVGRVWKIGNFNDAITLTETLAKQLLAGRKIQETLEFAEQFRANMIRLRSFVDSANFTDALNGVAVKVLKDTATFSDLLTAIVSKVFKDVVEFGDIITAKMNFKRSSADQLVVYDNLTYTATLRKAISDVLTFSDSVLGYRVKPLVPETLVLTDAVTGKSSKPLNDTLDLVDTAKFNKVQLKGFSDTLVLSDTETTKLIVKRQIADTLGFLDQLKGLHLVFGTASDTLVFSDKIVRTVFERTIPDTITLVDSQAYKLKGQRTITDTVLLSENLVLKKNFLRPRTDYLLFAEGFSVKIQYSGRGNGPTPVVQPVPLPPAPPAPPDGEPYFLPSVVWEGVIAVRPQVVLTGKTRAIVLPAPLFNDYVAGQARIAVQRSMSGRFRVYAKHTEREKLNWKFTLPKQKADEFEQFIEAEINNDLNMIDFKGNYWNVKILTDSVDFTEVRRWSPGGNAVEVTIELVGQRYA